MIDLKADDPNLLELMNALPVGFMAIDDDGQVAVINPAAVSILIPELQPSENLDHVGPMLRRLMPHAMAKAIAEPDRMGLITTGERVQIDGNDGATRFEMNLYRIGTGGLMVLLRDVTEEQRLRQEQRDRSLRLQRALLGRIDLTDLELSASYVPAEHGELSGGDWYDVISLDEDRYALVVGDVVGHDIEASATMGQLRAVIRAYALIDEQPDRVLDQTDSIAQTIEAAGCTTLSYVVFNRRTGQVQYTSAGHPPPLVVTADGTTRFLNGGRRPPLATFDATGTHRDSTTLGDGDVLILYTDGLIERRRETLDTGLDRLEMVASDLMNPRLTPEAASATAGGSEMEIAELVNALVSTMTQDSDHRDDVCVLAVRHRGVGA